MPAEEALYLDDKAIGRKIGIKPEMVEATLAALEKKGFPRRDPLFEEKRYWPAVRTFLDRRNGLGLDPRGHTMPLVPDGVENWEEVPRRPRRHLRPVK